MKSFAERQCCSDLSVFPHDSIPTAGPPWVLFFDGSQPLLPRGPMDPSWAAVPGQAGSVQYPGLSTWLCHPLLCEQLTAGSAHHNRETAHRGCGPGRAPGQEQTHGLYGQGLPSIDLILRHSCFSALSFLKMEVKINHYSQGHWEDSMT